MAGNKMAMLTEQKLKEMEAEMNRFEEEILTREGKLVPGQPRMIIGSNTYNKVQAKISKHGDHYHGDPHDDDGSGQEYDEDSSDVPNIPISVLSAPPPPPPSLLVGNKPRSTTPSLAPPPPPPPTLSFVPPQLRGQRPPPPPMPRPPMQGPPRPHPGYMGPGPGPFHGPSFHPGPPPPPSGMPPHMMPPGGPGSGPTGHVPPPFMSPNIGPQNMGGYGVSPGNTLGSTDSESAKTQDTIISKPKVVYSAAPVRLVPKGGHSKEKTTAEKTDKEKTGSNVTTDAGDKSQVMVGGTSGVLVGPAVMPPEREEGQGQGQESAEADDAGVGGKRAKKEKKKKYVRTAAGETWEDQSLEEWEPDDFRIFCGDLGNEVTDEVLARAFSKYTTFTKAKVIRDKRTNKTKGYGFVSFRDPTDFVRAMREMNGKYVGNRPIKLRKSTWKDRNIEIVRKKEKEKKRLGLR